MRRHMKQWRSGAPEAIIREREDGLSVSEGSTLGRLGGEGWWGYGERCCREDGGTASEDPTPL